ncbi:hypothetical protein T03_3712 [Trichinella britovi]|uniref:POU-specific domain-containing protein n=2 Tax=Trichinella TaxID=6333 RepID=A0A0V1D515_TRIBR|nr:hypothetical protein T05_11664 [Trichinella murrelli]KRY56573.1 hypothetical protein T03_3712 [Trichinella britovi]
MKQDPSIIKTENIRYIRCENYNRPPLIKPPRHRRTNVPEFILSPEDEEIIEFAEFCRSRRERLGLDRATLATILNQMFDHITFSPIIIAHFEKGIDFPKKMWNMKHYFQQWIDTYNAVFNKPPGSESFNE